MLELVKFLLLYPGLGILWLPGRHFVRGKARGSPLNATVTELK